jgi:hypothetical protein
MLGTRIDPGFLHGSLHHNGGILFFLLALFVVLLWMWWLNRGENRSNRKLPEEQQPAKVAYKV